MTSGFILDIPPISAIVAQCRVSFAGHQVISDVIFWRLPHPNRGRRPLNYIDVIGRDTQHEIEDLPKLMKDRDSWCIWRNASQLRLLEEVPR